MCKNAEDSDMKIVGSPHFTKEEGFDAVAFIEETKVQRFNGNSSKAKSLGSNIVSAFTYKTAPDDIVKTAAKYNITIDNDILLQIKILSVFTAEYCIDNYLPLPMLSSMAVCELYDVLENVAPDFYNELSNSAAFSFYYLCIKEDGDTAALVGKQFAMLCGKKNDKNYEALGTELHKKDIATYIKAIQAFSFV